MNEGSEYVSRFETNLENYRQWRIRHRDTPYVGPNSRLRNIPDSRLTSEERREKALADWIVKTREYYRLGTLKAKFLRRLKGVDFQFESHHGNYHCPFNDNFKDMCRQYRAYMKDNPEKSLRGPPVGPSGLGRWVKTVRGLHKRNNLSPWHYDQLFRTRFVMRPGKPNEFWHWWKEEQENFLVEMDEEEREEEGTDDSGDEGDDEESSEDSSET